MGWKVFVLDDRLSSAKRLVFMVTCNELEHGFHQIDLGIPQGEYSSDLIENRK